MHQLLFIHNTSLLVDSSKSLGASWFIDDVDLYISYQWQSFLSIVYKMIFITFLIFSVIGTETMQLPQLNRAKRIVGGAPASIKDFPYLVSIKQKSGGHLCGGTIIDKRLVLTAAHCFRPEERPADFSVSAGSVHHEKGKVHKIDTIVSHPNFTDGSEFDMALLVMAGSFRFTKFIQPAQLTDTESQVRAGDVVVTTGWGITQRPNSSESENSGEPAATKLRWVQLNVIDHKICREVYTNITDNVICAAAPGKDSCEGDSGGPLLLTNSSVVIGVVSGGYSCAVPKHPGLYSQIVPSVVRWIQDVIIKFNVN
jgi:secreted trypsin-like serine protease